MLIDGSKISKKRLKVLEEKISLLKEKPGLAFILIGEHPPSQTYVRMKKKACAQVGIVSHTLEFPEDISEHHLIQEIVKLNKDPSIHGILLQLPIPKHLDTKKIIETIDPKKDVDGFHPINLGKLLLGFDDGFIPCTPLGIKNLLQEENISVEGQHVVILGRSTLVGKPLANLLLQKKPGCNATVTVAHSMSLNLEKITSSADILIVAIGYPEFVTEKMVKKNSIIIDVGINRKEGKIVGDVDFKNVEPIVSKITPVPGGIGPMTITSLLENTYQSFLMK